MTRNLARFLLLASTLPGLFAASAEPPHPATMAAIAAADLLARDKAVADDVFEGRGPGTPAGERAAEWIADEMRRLGIAPGNGASYFQAVPSVTIAMDSVKSSLAILGPDGARPFKFADEAVWWTPHYDSADVTFDKAPLVFVGYGVVAPEENWNDYADVDVRGKVAVVLINDPGFITHDDTLFKGRAMTYYGRWTYKFEEAARQGAAGVIIVHETEPAAYGWDVVRNSNSGPISYLDTPDRNRSMIALRSWITHESAIDLFRRAGLDYETLKLAANKRGFKAIAMGGLTVSASMHSTVTHMTTRNIVGVVKGTTHPDDYVLYQAHWDHLGVKPNLAGRDQIYNGAIDNGIGVSMVLEIGEAFAKAQSRPERSIALLFPTLEEQGLLGSEYFAQHPLWPLSHIVAGINLDGDLPAGRARDLVVVGSGASELEGVLADVLKTQNRVVAPDPEPEKGYFYRSDHISLAKAGVPMLDPDGGFDLIDGGPKAGQAVRDAYNNQHYHQPSDEFDPNWDMSGLVDDVNVFYALGRKLADSELWPNWYRGNEFRAIRDASLSSK